MIMRLPAIIAPPRSAGLRPDFRTPIPDWRRHARPGESLTAARARGSAINSPIQQSTNPPAPAGLPSGLSTSLAKILRPQAAYRWLLPQLAAITPQYIEMILRGAMAGSHVQAWELFDLMEDTSPRLLKNLNELKRGVVSMDWSLQAHHEQDAPPTASAKRKLALVNAALADMRPSAAADENGLNGTIYDVLDAWGKGQAVCEIDWERRDAGSAGRNIIAPRATYWVHPTCVSWSMDGQLGLRLELLNRAAQGNVGPNDYTLTPGVWQTTSSQPLPSSVASFPPHKFLVSICKAKSGTALGGALLRPLAWWWCAGNFSADWLLNAAQLFGLPFRWANYDPGSPQATIDAICGMLQNLGSNGWAAFPAGVELKFLEASKTGDNSPQADLLDRAEKQMDLLILGQTLTSDTGGSGQGGGSLALGQVHAGVKAGIIQSAANFAASVLNSQLIPSILELNFGDDTEAPSYQPAPAKAEDTLANAQRDQVLLAAGVLMPKAWFYSRHDIPLPAPGEETIGGAPPAPAPGNPKSEAAEPNEGNEDRDEHPEADGKTSDEHEDALSGSNPSIHQSNNPAAAPAVAAAIGADLAHVLDRLAKILAIQDDAIFSAKLKAFLDDFPQLQKDLLADPAAARALQPVIEQAFLKGLAEGAPAPAPVQGSGFKVQGSTLPLAAADFSEDLHPRDAGGKFSDSGPGDGSRADRARSTYKPATQEKQHLGEKEEGKIAALIGGKNLDDNEPADVIKGRHAVEVKTLIDQKNDKITMHPDSLARKLKFGRKEKMQWHTVAIDARGDTPSYYYRKGVGSFRLGSMEKVDPKQLSLKFA